MLTRTTMLAAVFAFAIGMTACSDEPTTAPETQEVPELSASFEGGVDYTVLDEHVLVFDEVLPADLDALVTGAGGSVVHAYPEIAVAVVTGMTDEAVGAVVGDVGIFERDIELDLIPTPDATPELAADAGGAEIQATDPTGAFFWGQQWNMMQIGVDDAFNAGFTGDPAVRVAILDTGLDPYHIDLVGRVDIANSVSFVPNFWAGPFPWVDDHTHGSHVGGTVASNNFGTASVAPDVMLVAVKVCNYLGSCPLSAIFGGLFYAGSIGVDVINMSLGGFILKSGGGGALNAAYNRAVNFANSRGVLVVTSAGNSGLDLQKLGQNFGPYEATPCMVGTATCISATNRGYDLAGYSNYGKNAIDFAAPGGEYNSHGNGFLDNVIAPCSQYSVPYNNPCSFSNTWYIRFQGTSMASPHVAGLAALIDSEYGGARKAGGLKSAIQKGAVDLGKKGADAYYGKGFIDVCGSLGC